jgi:hypothetical protein
MDYELARLKELNFIESGDKSCVVYKNDNFQIKFKLENLRPKRHEVISSPYIDKESVDNSVKIFQNKFIFESGTELADYFRK